MYPASYFLMQGVLLGAWGSKHCWAKGFHWRVVCIPICRHQQKGCPPSALYMGRAHKVKDLKTSAAETISHIHPTAFIQRAQSQGLYQHEVCTVRFSSRHYAPLLPNKCRGKGSMNHQGLHKVCIHIRDANPHPLCQGWRKQSLSWTAWNVHPQI